MDNFPQSVIKICGLSNALSARVAMESGATALGFMLAESRRRVTPSQVADILGELPAQRPKSVGVTVNLSPVEILHIVSLAGVDVIQLSGDESVDILASLEIPVWKAFRFGEGTTAESAYREIEPWLSHAKPVGAILVDAAVAGRYGGTGHRADWDLAAQLAKRYPLILAGGLSPDNVADAIDQVRPLGVDVSSGVEQGKKKDPDLIRSFVQKGRQGFEFIG